MYAFLGTRAAFNDDGRDGDGKPLASKDRQLLRGKRRVEVVFPPGHRLGDAFKEVTDAGGLWASQSPHPAPAWVASDNALLAQLLGEHYGVEVRDPLPAGERGEFTSAPAAAGGDPTVPSTDPDLKG